MTSIRSFAPAVAGLVLAAGALAQDVPLDQIHPRTMITLGVGIGDQDLETNTGNLDPLAPPAGILSRSASALLFRLRGEHFFQSDFGFHGDIHIGNADDINEDIGATNSSYDSWGVYLAAAYRATMGESFRLPVRFGPFLHTTEEDASDTTGSFTVERMTLGVRLSAEPEYVIFQRAENARVTELSAFADISCGAGPSQVDGDFTDTGAGTSFSLDEDAYAFTLSYEIGLRYRFPNGFLASLSWYANKYHVGTTESYSGGVLYGIDDDFSGIMIAAGLRF
jgi:hypothetical protein